MPIAELFKGGCGFMMDKNQKRHLSIEKMPFDNL